MARVILIFLMILGVLSTSYSQSEQGSLELYLNTIIDNLPGSSGGDFDPPSTADLEKWEAIVSATIRGELDSARLLVGEVDYKLVEFTETTDGSGQLFYILEQAEPGGYWGTYVFNANPCRKELVIQSTHPRYDTNTGYQAAYCFTRLSAAALFISGTHRCNHPSPSNCSGTTSACNGTSQGFRKSDVAHNIKTAFQVATQVMAEIRSSTVYVQLHGFAKKNTDPYVILSNGTREVPDLDYALLIRDGLTAADQSLTFKVAHIDRSWTRLIAFTNTQGRALNESTDACTAAASSATGRFIHVEQEKSKLREDSDGWNKMYLALASAFDCDASVNVHVDKVLSEVLIYPNPFSDQLFIKAKDIQSIRLFNMQGKEVYAKKYYNSSQEVVKLKNSSSGPLILQLLASDHITSRLIFSMVAQ